MKKISYLGFISLILLNAHSVWACNVNDYVKSAAGQELLEEMDAEAKKIVTDKLTEMGMPQGEFSIESKIPHAFVSINPGGQYAWFKFKINLPKELKTYYSGILISKVKKQTFDQFDRVASEVCGAEITFDPGVIVNKKSFRSTGAELVRFPSMTKFVPLSKP